MGIDDLPLGRAVNPSLTTVRFDFGALAHSLAEIVDDRVNGRETTTSLVSASHEVVVRESA